MARSRQYAIGDALLCAACVPDRLEPEEHPVETDRPPHCHWCGAPLVTSLTSRGIEAVLQELVGWLRNPSWWFAASPPIVGKWAKNQTHYTGQPVWAMPRDWAKDLQDYAMSASDRYVVDLFLANVSALEARGPVSVSRPPEPAPQRRRLPKIVEDQHGDAARVP